jgi:dienelactone hydrolase
MKRKIVLGTLGLFSLLLLASFGYLLTGQYEAVLSQDYQLTETSFGYAKVHDSNVGVIVYGGGKVDPRSYAYLTQLEANVFLVEFPFNLAVFDIVKGNRVMAEYPTITQWIVVGHSLGGSMGYLFADQADVPVAGVVYLAAYPTGESNIPALALFGSKDGLIQAEEYQDRFKPSEFVLIEGANHAQFGEYGPQANDFDATIRADAQRTIVLERIARFIDSLQT